MKKEEIGLKVLELLEKSELIPRDLYQEKLEYRYLDEGHIDSFDLFNFIVEIEVVFNITLSPEDTQSDDFRTPGGVVTLVCKRLTK